jgi:hypothetical protein
VSPICSSKLVCILSALGCLACGDQDNGSDGRGGAAGGPREDLASACILAEGQYTAHYTLDSGSSSGFCTAIPDQPVTVGGEASRLPFDNPDECESSVQEADCAFQVSCSQALRQTQIRSVYSWAVRDGQVSGTMKLDVNAAGTVSSCIYTFTWQSNQ